MERKEDFARGSQQIKEPVKIPALMLAASINAPALGSILPALRGGMGKNLVKQVS